MPPSGAGFSQAAQVPGDSRWLAGASSLSHLRWGHGARLVLARSASEFAFWATRHRAAVTLTYRCSRGQQRPVLETSVQE